MLRLLKERIQLAHNWGKKANGLTSTTKKQRKEEKEASKISISVIILDKELFSSEQKPSPFLNLWLTYCTSYHGRNFVNEQTFRVPKYVVC